jgi:hypothetical protein
MPSPIAFSLRLLCIALAFSCSVLFAAEPTSPLLGSSRDQVVSKLGEPRSQLAVGNRLVMLYARERIVLRDGVVVDVERLAAEPVRRPAQVSAPAALPVAVAATPAPATTTVGTGTDLPPGIVAPASAPAATSAAAVTPAAIAAAASPAAAPAATDAGPVVKVEPTPPAAPEPKLEIKLVRPPSAGTVNPPPVRATAKPASQQVAPPSSPPPPASPDPKQSTATPAAALASKEAATAPSPAASTAPVNPASGTTVPLAAAKPESATEPAAESAAKAEATEAEEKAKRAAEKAAALAAEKKAKLIKASRRRLEAVVDDAIPVPATSGISTRTYVLAIITVAGGVALLFWRVRQRSLELAATRVSQTPFSSGAPQNDAGGAQFSAEFLGKLEWKRFEELVEAYYSKTGVVATRNKGGPASAAQVKIAWKGEPRPFALVRCVSHPPDLIEVKPLQELYTLLAAEDIRRGYVVTTGRFSVPARDYAEEKHLTLLPGEIFLEKLNALPGPARTEIMNAASAGDCTTPSCPTCEAKMTRSTEVPSGWRCATHPDATLST